MCGIIGIENNNRAGALAVLGLMTLQHRGEESAGITISGKGALLTHKGMGLVSAVFARDVISSMPGTAAIGHVRYTTSSGSSLENAQPFYAKYEHGEIAVAHNGNITNFPKLRREFASKGALFAHSSDTEILLHLIAAAGGKPEHAVPAAVSRLEGAFSLVFLKGKTLIGARDADGFRPLILGKAGKSYILASESAAVEIIGGKCIREIKPCEIIIIENGKIKKSFLYKKPKKQNSCIFEQIYFSRPDSALFGKTVKESREELGRRLAKQMKHIKADIVMPVPDSGFFAAQGFSRESGIRFENGFVRNHYMGRSFIKPSQELRELAARLKLSVIKEVVKGKDIVVIDDSLVRGTTSRRIIRSLREAGANKIHLALSCPPVISPCYYGIDTPVKEQLISAQKTKEEIKKYLNADSVTFLSLDNLIKSCLGNAGGSPFCTACFTGKYPVKNKK